MAQGLFGGMTNYDNQSLKDIASDIQEWIRYTSKVKVFFEERIEYLKNINYFDEIPYDFRMTLLNSLVCFNTFLDDMNLILKVINQHQVSNREVQLLQNIGKVSFDNNHIYGKTFREEREWRKYGEANFTVAERLYSEGRDFFVTLQDASNAASRLNDYMTQHQITNNHINQTISGNNNIVSGINNGVMLQNNMDNSQLVNDISRAITEIEKIDDVEMVKKNFVLDILKDTQVALKEDNIEVQTTSKEKLKAFLLGAGKSVISILNILGSYASIASFFTL